MKKDPLIFLIHIGEYLDKIISSVRKKNKRQFLEDELLKDATLRRLEVIGEAIKNLPEGFRKKHKEIEWKKIAGLRDKLIHHYFGIDPDAVWAIIKNDVPKLKEDISEIIKKIE